MIENERYTTEGWLLADPDVIRQYLGPTVTIAIPPSASLDCRPKNVMKANMSDLLSRRQKTAKRLGLTRQNLQWMIRRFGVKKER